MEIYRTENLSFKYPGRVENALSDISLSVRQGEFVTICGVSGSGKSTLLRMFKPELAPHGEKRGRIYFENRQIEETDKKELISRIGFIMQNYENQLVTDKVWHELAFGAESLGLKTEEIRARVSEMASFFGIQHWFHKKISELSGGQKQILNLASVMVMNPSVIILDEPMSQLDPIAAEDFLNVLVKINRELGITVIISEQRLNEVLQVSDRAIVMEKGRIIADGAPDEVCKTLHETGNDFFAATPVPMRVYYEAPNDFECPLTIREGRQWLEKMVENREVGISEKPARKMLKNSAPEMPQTSEAVKRAENPVVQLKDIWFRYEKKSENIVKGLSLSIKRGEILCIMGGNGTGKTTALSVIGGILKPQRGKLVIEKNLKTAILPQNPQTIFLRKTVEEDLKEMLLSQTIESEEKMKRFESVVGLCNLNELCGYHPYDLSGGEQQRAALAKVLLGKPDILLLDEPTKGLDVNFKEKLGEILKKLAQEGVAIVMVSHDMEFSAKFADRCAMFFDGGIVSEADPVEFFSQKSFYTTAANRMARNILPEAVLAEDIIDFLRGQEDGYEGAENLKKTGQTEEYEPHEESGVAVKSEQTGQLGSAGESGTDVQSGQTGQDGESESTGAYDNLRECRLENYESDAKSKSFWRKLITGITIFALMPLTIFAGVYIFDDRKYYFISLLLLIEIMAPVALSFELRKMKARELVLISVFCAAAVAGRAVFFMLPQVKPVAAFVIIGGVCFGAETGFLVGAMTAFVSNFFFGQGPWTPWQMFSFGVIGFLAGVIFKKRADSVKRLTLSVFGFVVVLIIYGGIMNPASVIMYQSYPTWEMFASAYVLGFPFDIIHAASTFLFLMLMAKPVQEKLQRIKTKYGILEKKRE